MLFNGDSRYNYSSPQDEEAIKRIVQRYSKEIFGEKSVFLDLKSGDTSKPSIVYIPDGYVIAFDERIWCIILIELSNRKGFYKYATTQLNKFYLSVEKPSVQYELVDALSECVEKDGAIFALFKEKTDTSDISGYLRDLLSRPPQIVVITDEMGEQVQQILSGLRSEPSVLRFKMFIPERAKKPCIYLFEPFSIEKFSWKLRRTSTFEGRLKPGEFVPISEYELPILESIIELGGTAKAGKVLNRIHEKMQDKMTKRDHEKLSAGSIRWEKLAQWARFDLKRKGLIDKNTPHGTWKITRSGRQYYENLKSKDSQE